MRNIEFQESHATPTIMHNHVALLTESAAYPIGSDMNYGPRCRSWIHQRPRPEICLVQSLRPVLSVGSVSDSIPGPDRLPAFRLSEKFYPHLCQPAYYNFRGHMA